MRVVADQLVVRKEPAGIYLASARIVVVLDHQVEAALVRRRVVGIHAQIPRPAGQGGTAAAEARVLGCHKGPVWPAGDLAGIDVSVAEAKGSDGRVGGGRRRFVGQVGAENHVVLVVGAGREIGHCNQGSSSADKSEDGDWELHVWALS